MANQPVILTIDSLTDKGDGIAQLDQRRIFVSGALPGEEVAVALKDVKPRYAQGELLYVRQASADRAEPFCAHSDCGGCQIGTLAYPAQLAMKTQRVAQALAAKGIDAEVAPCIGMDSPLKFRNKALYNVLKQKGKAEIGFFKKHSHELVATDDCPVQADQVAPLVALVRDWMREFGVLAYDEASHSGQVRGLMVRNGQHSGQWLLVLVALTEAVPHLEVLSERLQAQCPWLTSLVLNINPERTNRVLGFEDKVLFGPGYIEERLGHLDFNLSPQSFFQVNPSQTEQLYGLVQDFAGLDGSQVVFDLYSGVGTIALFLAAKAAKVVGIESVAQAVADARQNAERNQITNVEFHQGQAEVLMPALYEQGQRADVVVLDPPRKGCDKALLDTLLAMAPQAVVYVSCDPANLGRDLAVLLAGGYRLDKVQPLDMFPHSLHVETLVLLKRN